MRDRLPKAFSQELLHRQLTPFQISQMTPRGDNDKISVVLFSMNTNELPQFFMDDGPSGVGKTKEEKSFKIPVKFTLEKVIEYMYNDMNLHKHIITTPEYKKDACRHIELLIKSNVMAPEDGQP
jgi:hypothetical protein